MDANKDEKLGLDEIQPIAFMMLLKLMTIE
jgi:hypothetical protein